jgi:uncharacterized protein YeaO (DUF488 family)
VIRTKRTYDPASRGDGRRILVERLWPRGMKKGSLAADAWMKEVAPSTELRKWFGHRPERWAEFRRRYWEELDANPGVWKPIRDASRRGPVTLLYSARDTEHNSAVALRDYLERGRARPGKLRGRRDSRGARKASAARGTKRTARKTRTRRAKRAKR